MTSRGRARRESAATLLTFGHGTASQEDLLRLLHRSDVRAVVDVRRFPGSRRHPHVATTELERWLPAGGIGYRWDPRLGGRRRVPAEAGDADPWWRVESFRAYAAHTRTPEFGAALDELLGDLGGPSTAIMCSEALWWRCHRRLIADVALLLHGVDVGHLWHDGSWTAHVPSAGARVDEGRLRYDASGA